MSYLEQLGSQIRIQLETDGEGYLGRECPVETCLGYFKITPGTGLKGSAPCHCPYCGHVGDQKTFFTKEQIEYAKSVAIRRVKEAIHKDLKAMEFEHKPSGPFGIGISMRVKESSPHPISYYREKKLETKVTCEKCTLKFAIYGVFGWCPDCGAHNSFQILSKNLEMARKELTLAASQDEEMADYLVRDALENIVSAFDGFGREVAACKGAEVRFQNIAAARERIRELFDFDFASDLTASQWDDVGRVFQKRHLLAHKMGVIDEEYVRKANDTSAVVGRSVRVSSKEVSDAIAVIETLGRRLFDG
jgi:hypothetical protein